MQRAKRIAIVVVTALVTIYLGAAWFFSGLIVAFETKPLDQDRINLDIDSPADFGLGVPMPLRIKTDDGHIAAWFFEHPNPAGCAVIASHGHTGTRYGGLKYLAPFYRRGCHGLAIDARYHGESSGEFGTYGYYEKRDMLRVISRLKEQTGLATNRIGLIGESMGAAISLQTAALLPEDGLAFVIGDSSFQSLDSILRLQGQRQYGPAILALYVPARGIAEYRAEFEIDQVAPVEYATRIQVPVLLIHSRTDDFTPPEHSEAILEAIPHDRKMLRITDWGAEHGRSIDSDSDAYSQILREFLNLYVPGFGRGV